MRYWALGARLIALGLVCAGFDGDIAVPQMASVKWVVIVGLCGLTAHLCITSALRCAPASIVSPMDFARLPIIAVVGMLLYGEPLEVAVRHLGAVQPVVRQLDGPRGPVDVVATGDGDHARGRFAFWNE